MITVLMSACVSVWCAKTPSEFARPAACRRVKRAGRGQPGRARRVADLGDHGGALFRRSGRSTRSRHRRPARVAGRGRAEVFVVVDASRVRTRARPRRKPLLGISLVDAMPIFSDRSQTVRIDVICSTFWWM
jgi:Mg-chelatase subunit ChlD